MSAAAVPPTPGQLGQMGVIEDLVTALLTAGIAPDVVLEALSNHLGWLASNAPGDYPPQDWVQAFESYIIGGQATMPSTAAP